MPDPKLDIKITTSGAAQAGRELEGVGQSAAKLGKETAAAGAKVHQGFQQFSRAGNDAAAVIGNLENASRGGIAGIFGIANAMRALINIVRGAVAATGPLGLLVTLLGTGLAAAMALFSRNAQAAETSVDGLRTAAEELGRVQFEALKQRLGEIRNAASDATSEFARLSAAAQKVDDAQTAARIAKIRADSNLTEEQRARAIDAEELGASGRSRGRQLDVLQNTDAAAQRAVTETLDVLNTQGSDLQSARDRLSKLKARMAAQDELRSLRWSGAESEDQTIRDRVSELQKIIGEGAPTTEEDIEAAAADVKRLGESVDTTTNALQAMTIALVQARGALTTEKEISPQIATAEGEKRDADLSVVVRGIQQKATPATPAAAPLIEPSDEGVKAAQAQLAALNDAKFRDSTFGGNPRLNQQIEAATAALGEAQDSYNRALSAFTENVQISAKLHRKGAREIEKVNARAKDSRQ